MTTLESIAYRKKYTGMDDLRESEREREKAYINITMADWTSMELPMRDVKRERKKCNTHKNERGG